MKTKLVIEYNDATDTYTARVVQGTQYGDTLTEMTNGENNSDRNLIKRLSPIWKAKPPKENKMVKP
jgi:hypothetical protein